jgi:hypothetical protein
LAPRGEFNEQLEATWYCLSEGLDLGDRGDWAFDCVFGPGSVDLAWRLDDEVIVYGISYHAREKTVRLRRRTRMLRCELSVPASNF